MKYYVDYGTGAGNFISEKSLSETKKEAVEGIRYTQKDVSIYEVSDNFTEDSLEWALTPKLAAVSFFIFSDEARFYKGKPIACYGKSYCYTAWQDF